MWYFHEYVRYTWLIFLTWLGHRFRIQQRVCLHRPILYYMGFGLLLSSVVVISSNGCILAAFDQGGYQALESADGVLLYSVSYISFFGGGDLDHYGVGCAEQTPVIG